MKRLAALALTGLLATPLAALDLENMNDQERRAFEAAVRAYLLEHPQVIMDAVAVLEQRQADAQQGNDLAMIQNKNDEIFHSTHSWTGGNLNGDVTLVEFMDYRCGYCKKAHDDIAALVKQDGNIRLVVKEFPILGEESTIASRFAIATRIVAGDDAYKAMSDTLMMFRGPVNEASLRRMAEGLDLDYDAINAEFDSDAVTAAITETRALAQHLQISGTPTFVLRDQMVRGYVPLDGMVQIIAETRGE